MEQSTAISDASSGDLMELANKRRQFRPQQSTVASRRQQAVCVRRAFKQYGSKSNANVILDGLNMTVPKGTMWVSKKFEENKKREQIIWNFNLCVEIVMVFFVPKVIKRVSEVRSPDVVQCGRDRNVSHGRKKSFVLTHVKIGAWRFVTTAFVGCFVGNYSRGCVGAASFHLTPHSGRSAAKPLVSVDGGEKTVYVHDQRLASFILTKLRGKSISSTVKLKL